MPNELDPNFYYHLTLNKLVRYNEYSNPPGLMTLAPDGVNWQDPDGNLYPDISAIMGTVTLPPSSVITPSCPSRFVWERLTASEDWTSEHKDRLFEEVQVSTKVYPYGVVTVDPHKPFLFTGIPEVIGKVVTEIEIISVRSFPQGQGSWFPFDLAYKAMYRALSGAFDYTVTYNGDILGNVATSTYLRDVKRKTVAKGQGDLETLHYGMVIKVIWS